MFFLAFESPTLTVTIYFLHTRVFTLKGTLFTETTKTTKDSGILHWKLSSKGPPFHFSPFLHNLQFKGSPFCFFSVLRAFFQFFKCLQSVIHTTVVIFCNRLYVVKGSPFTFFATFFAKEKV